MIIFQKIFFSLKAIRIIILIYTLSNCLDTKVNYKQAIVYSIPLSGKLSKLSVVFQATNSSRSTVRAFGVTRLEIEQ